MTGADYRVNKSTGQVVKDDGTGWKPVASVRNKTTGEILIDEGNGWQPLPSAQRDLQPDPAMNMASQRANQALAVGQKIAPDDLTQLGRPDFSGAAMARLPAPTMSEADLDSWTAQKQTERQQLQVPDNDFKERTIAALNGPTFGNAPRLAAGSQTIGALLATPFVEGDIIDQKGISGATSQFLDEARIHQRRGREERPVESLATEFVPGLLTGKTLVDAGAKFLFRKPTTVNNVGRFMTAGAGYGALYGASQNESGTLEGAAGDGAVGAGIGAAFGGALKAGQAPATVTVRGAKQVGAEIYDALAGLLGKVGGARDKVADDVAIAAVRRSMERSGMTIDQIMDLVKRYEDKPAVLAEVLGQDAINALTALTRRPGSTPQKAQDLIEERFYGRPDRLKADVEDATGIPIGQLDETLTTQLTERQAAAKPIYDALYKRYNTIKSFGESLKRINRIARTPAMQKHLKLAEEAVKTQAALRQVPISKMSKMEYWDLVKRSLDDEINSAVAKGEARTKVGASVEELTQLKRAITDEFDRLTDGAYATARQAGGEAPRLKAAAAAGQKALQARNPREVANTVAATLAQDLPALRAGIVDDLGTRIDKGMTPGRVRVPDVAGKLRAGLGEESANKLINKFDAEATLSETGARWAPRMNSVTGTVMESGATAMGDDLVNAGMNLATGNKVGLVRQAINFMRTRGFSQRQIDAIGDLLLSSPEEGLKRLKVMKPDGTPTNAFAPAASLASPNDVPMPTPTGTPSIPPPAGPKGGGGGGFAAARAQGKVTPEERAMLLGNPDDDAPIKSMGFDFARPRVAKRQTQTEPFYDERLGPRGSVMHKAVEMRRNGYTVREIADEMDTSEGVIHTVVSQAKSRGVDVGGVTRERSIDDILALKEKGLTGRQIADRLGLGVENVKSVLSQQRAKLGADAPAWLAPEKPGRTRSSGLSLPAGLKADLGNIGVGGVIGTGTDINQDGTRDWKDFAIGGGALGLAGRIPVKQAGARTVGKTATAGFPTKPNGKLPPFTPGKLPKNAPQQGLPSIPPDPLTDAATRLRPERRGSSWNEPAGPSSPAATAVRVAQKISRTRPEINIGRAVSAPGRTVAAGMRAVDRRLRAPEDPRMLQPVIAPGQMRAPASGNVPLNRPAIERMKNPGASADTLASVQRRAEMAYGKEKGTGIVPGRTERVLDTMKKVEGYVRSVSQRIDEMRGQGLDSRQMKEALDARADIAKAYHDGWRRVLAARKSGDANELRAAQDDLKRVESVWETMKKPPGQPRGLAQLERIDAEIQRAMHDVSGESFLFGPSGRQIRQDNEVADLLTNPARAQDALKVSKAKPLGTHELKGQAAFWGGAAGAGALAIKGAKDEERKKNEDYFAKRDAWDHTSKHVATYTGERLQAAQEFMNAVVLSEGEQGPRPDGKFGPRTSEIVRRYQKMRGLTVNGRMTWETIEDLESEMNGAPQESAAR